MAEADERAGLLAPPRATGKSVVSWWHGVVAGGLLLFVAGLSDEVQGLWRTRQASAIVRGQSPNARELDGPGGKASARASRSSAH